MTKEIMYVVYMEVDGETYIYGKYSDERKANEVAMQVRRERDVETYVVEE